MTLSFCALSFSIFIFTKPISGTTLSSTVSGLQPKVMSIMTTLITFALCMISLPNINDVWDVSEDNFNAIALEIFQYQAKNNKVYAEYLQLIDKQPKKVEHFTQIPFLPISFFKTHQVVCGNYTPQKIFESSSTTGLNTSKHLVKDVNLYHTNCLKIIEQKLGYISEYQISGLLPSYLERDNSSLVSMVAYLMKHNNQESAFFMYNHSQLFDQLQNSSSKQLLFGVSFALLDFAENHNVSSQNLTIIETGGMKGRKKEMTKAEVYAELKRAFPNATIISEYGMTELLSQAYSDANALYTCPPWMKVLPRADNDPLSHEARGHTAALNIIDLANLHTCSFIATDDLGKVYNNGKFEVSGRIDYSDIRGCSLMVM